MENRRLHESLFGYLKPSEEQIKDMTVVRAAYKTLLDILEEKLPQGRYKSLTITALEESAMWANKSITRYDNGSPRPGAET